MRSERMEKEVAERLLMLGYDWYSACKMAGEMPTNKLVQAYYHPSNLRGPQPVQSSSYRRPVRDEDGGLEPFKKRAD